MERRVAGLVAVLLVSLTASAIVGLTAVAPAGLTDANEVVTDPAVSGDWTAAAIGIELVAIGLLATLGVGSALAWYFSVRRTGASDEPTATAPETAVENNQNGQTPVAEAQSDEERVLELLEENDGQMKQARIVEHTDWSKSKVSMLLSEMESDGAISKLRVGRENLISLAGEEPEAAGSPFEELQE